MLKAGGINTHWLFSTEPTGIIPKLILILFSWFKPIIGNIGIFLLWLWIPSRISSNLHSLLVVLLVFVLLVLLLVPPLLQVLILNLMTVGEKIFKLEIGDIFYLSLLCGIDQALNIHLFTGLVILLLLSITLFITNFITANALRTCSNPSRKTLKIGTWSRPVSFS